MEQLPLLATLKGNDFLNFKDLVHFHRNLIQAKNGKKWKKNVVFPKLAEFIRRQGVDMDLKEFARKILRNESKASIMQVLLVFLTNQIASAKKNTIDNHILKFCTPDDDPYYLMKCHVQLKY